MDSYVHQYVIHGEMGMEIEMNPSPCSTDQKREIEETTMGAPKWRETILLHLEGANKQTEQGGTTTHEQRAVQRTAGTSRLLAAAAAAATSGGRPESPRPACVWASLRYS
jgi:hypothetical protein